MFVRKLISYFKIVLSSAFSTIIDILVILTSFSISIYLWYTYKILEYVDINKVIYHLPLIFNFLLCWLFISYLTQLYKQNNFSFILGYFLV